MLYFIKILNESSNMINNLIFHLFINNFGKIYFMNPMNTSFVYK